MSANETRMMRGGVIERLRRLPGDEEGQSLIFGVLSIFIVLFFVSMILNVGEVTTRRMQLQLAADSASYSSAALQAQILNSLTVVNSAMAQVRARSLRYAVDVNAYGVLAELRDRYLGTSENADTALAQEATTVQSQLTGLQQQLAAAAAAAPPDPNLIAQIQGQIQVAQARLSQLTTARLALHQNGDLNGPLIQPDPARLTEVVGLDGADALYAEAYQRAQEWLPAGSDWVTELSRLEYTIAILAPRLAGEAAYEMAKSNGAKYVNVFPSQRWHPRGEAYDAWNCEKLGDQWWRLSHVGGGTVIEARQEPGGDCRSCGQCGNARPVSCWSFNVIDGPSVQLNYRLCDLGTNANGERNWMVENLASQGADRITCITQHKELVVVRWGPQGLTADVLPGTDPKVYMISNDNGIPPENTIFVRTKDGKVQQATYKKDGNGNWIRPLEYPDDADFADVGVTRMKLGGVDFNVNFDPYYALPGSAKIWITQPPWFERSWRGEDGTTRSIRIDFSNPIAMSASLGGLSFWVREDRFGFGRRGHILTMGDADGIPRKFFDRSEEYWWEHQLTATGTDQWLYEYKEFGALLEPETNIARLMAMRDVDRAGLPDPAVNEWSDPEAVPSWAYDPQANDAGWLNAWTGKLQANSGAAGVPAAESQYAYYQKRPCWDMMDTKNGTVAPDGLWDLTDANGNTVQIECPTCKGRGYVVVGASDVFGRHGRLSRSDPDPILPRPGQPAQGPQADDYQEANLDLARRPLVLSTEFFKFGVTVGTWRSREDDFKDAAGSPVQTGTLEQLLHDPRGGLKGLWTAQDQQAADSKPVYYPEWGYFAVSAARVRLRDGSNDPAFLETCRFEDPAARERWVKDNLYNLYLIARPGTDGSSINNYWSARLISLDRQIITEDVVLGPGEPAQTGTAWLLSLIARGSPRSGEQTMDWPAGWTDGWDGRDVPEVRQLLTTRLRPRRPYPNLARPYLDSEGGLRDPFTDRLVSEPRSDRRLGGQLNYDQLDSENVKH